MIISPYRAQRSAQDFYLILGQASGAGIQSNALRPETAQKNGDL
jgi:hypothetical protein